MSSESKNPQKVEILANLVVSRTIILKNGYEPIPIVGKQTYISGWPSGEITPERIFTETRKHTDHLNTGLRCGRLVGVDIDLRNEEHAQTVRELVEELISPTPLRRVGSKGMMLCYQKRDEPIPKIIIGEKLPDSEKTITLVEIFGTRTQFVGFGIHPDTHKPYRWLERNYSPITVPFGELPTVDTPTIHLLCEGLLMLLSELGYNTRMKTSVVQTEAQTPYKPIPSGIPRDAVDITELFLRRIPSARPSPSGYLNFPCPSCHCADKRAGIQVLSNGGFNYKCQHAGCEFHEPTGWQPPSRYAGKRVVRLYELLGGDPSDLNPRHRFLGVESVEQMLAELRQPSLLRASK